MIKGYRCDFCDCFMEIEKEMVTHELRCHDNPKNRTCATCRHAYFLEDEKDWPNCTVNSRNFMPIRWKIKCEDWGNKCYVLNQGNTTNMHLDV